MPNRAAPSLPSGPDNPALWLGSSALLDLEDPRLRLRALALTQLCRTPREQMLALYAFVKRIPFAKPRKLRLRAAREVLDASTGDAEDKANLLVALLRCCGFSARLRYIEVDGCILQGLTTALPSVARPLVEVWRQGHWIATDTYIFDARYITAARKHMRQQHMEWGFGMHVHGDSLWDGRHDVFLTGSPELTAAVSLGEIGVFHDPLEFYRSDVCRARFPKVARLMRWNLLTASLDRAVTDLRAQAGVDSPAQAGVDSPGPAADGGRAASARPTR
jgi:hypothetical protein